MLQRPKDDTAYAIPGGHVVLGETNEETLVREFKEEINVDIKVGTLKWVGEIFFSWIDIKDIETIELYPIEAKKYLTEGLNQVEHLM